MKKQGARRKVKKRKSTAQNSRVKLGGFLGIMLLAVFLGYLTARFVVGPFIGYDANESPAKAAEEEQSSEASDPDTGEEAEDAEEAEETGSVPADGYALQFGAFSTREAAEELAETLESQGIRADIVEIDDVYKVISPVVDTKEKALESLSSLPDIPVEDVFIASF